MSRRSEAITRRRLSDHVVGQAAPIAMVAVLVIALTVGISSRSGAPSSQLPGWAERESMAPYEIRPHGPQQMPKRPAARDIVGGTRELPGRDRSQVVLSEAPIGHHPR